MDRFGEWRPIPPAAKDDADEQSPASKPAKPAVSADGPEANASSVRLFGLLGAGILAVVGLVVWVANPGSGSGTRLDVSAAAGFFSLPTPGKLVGSRGTIAPAEIVVDVQGAVARPGIHRLPAGSRVADAIDASGGYSAQVDLASAAAALNLAAPLTDGAKIHVPARGEEAATPTAGVGGPGGNPAGALINVNTATAEQLDTLPGVGPVTAAKIIAAREQAPFATVDELVTRDVMGEATLEKLRALVTVNP
jgi:competence protein ComEA